jgi:pimeloyl-ACP methyl ester carboxylesterase
MPNRTLLDGAREMALLADYLGIGRFGVMGISGGVPTVLACAFALADRLQFVVDLAGAVPLYRDPEALKQLGTMDRFYARIGARMPLWLFQIPFFLLGFQQRVLKSPRSFSKIMRSSMCGADMELFENPHLQYLFMRDFQELFRQGSRGAALDAQLIYLPWGFDVCQIKIHVEIYQGTEDRWGPESFSRDLAGALPDASLHLIPDAGHFYHMLRGDDLFSELRENT